MNREEMASSIAKALIASPDRDQGRRLAVVESTSGTWRVAYLVPHYRNAWRPGMPPDGWMPADWLDHGEPNGNRQIRDLPTLVDAKRAAREVRAEVLRRHPDARLEIGVERPSA